MRQQVAYGHRPVRFGEIAVVINLEIPEAGNVAMHGLVELKMAVFIQHHQRDARDGLGHRVDAEDGIFMHVLVGFDVHLPLAFEVGYLPLSGDNCDRAGQLSRLDVVLCQQVDLDQAGT